MVAADNPLDRAGWRLRSDKEFGTVRAYDHGRPIVVMEFDPDEQDRIEEWIWLRHLWLGLPAHPQLLDAIACGSGAKLLLRYPALDWKQAAIRLESSMSQQVVATWGAQLTDLFRVISNELPEAEAGHFLRPLVKIDLINSARVAFLPADHGDPYLPPEVAATWPRCDERAFVHVVGRTIRDLYYVGLDLPAAAKIQAIVERCSQHQPSKRYRTLDDLQAAWAQLAFPMLEGDRLLAWQHAEEGIGWLELGEARSASCAFREAIQLNPRLRVAKAGRERALAALGESSNDRASLVTSGSLESRNPAAREEGEAAAAVAPLASPRKPPTWEEAVARGRRLEAEHELAEALSLYSRVPMDGVNDAEIHAAIARCRLALGAVDHAMGHALRALAIDPKNVAALSVSAGALLRQHRYTDALRTASDWAAIGPDDAGAYYARGRALFALGRFVEARDAFDRVCALRPRMVEAMLLRREADRSIKRTAEQTGTARVMEVEVPAHLEQLRDALVSGRVQDAIPVLERPEYDDDAVAKLVHAECLAFDQRFEEALAMYDRAAALSLEQRPKAVIGKVHALLSLDRAVEALAELDGARDIVDVELVELRGLVLRRIGLEGDAERELGRVVAASGGRSDLRVGRR